jgi:hypothetical protein
MTQWAEAKIAGPVRLGAVAKVLQCFVDQGVPDHAEIRIAEERPLPGIIVQVRW